MQRASFREPLWYVWCGNPGSSRIKNTGTDTSTAPIMAKWNEMWSEGVLIVCELGATEPKVGDVCLCVVVVVVVCACTSAKCRARRSGGVYVRRQG